MITTNWSIEFQYLILAAALRGDLLKQVSLDPELFRSREKGPQSPIQQVAEIITTYYAKYQKPPTRIEFDQLISEDARTPERRGPLADTAASVWTIEIPEDPSFIRDRVTQQLELRAFEQAMLTTAPMLSQPDRLEEAREIMAKAMEPITVNGDDLAGVLIGTRSTGRREIIPGLIVENDTTSFYGHGDTGKSLTGLVLGAIAQSGCQTVPSQIRPRRQANVAYLDWETDKETANDRLGRIAEGLSIAVPGIYYRRMAQPLVDAAPGLVLDLRRRGIEVVIIDSLMYAMGGGDDRNGMVTSVIKFFNACRLFAPAARLVLNHITAQEAAGKPGTARPFAGAFAHNGPRLTWRLTRDLSITDATAITFVCTKANNLPRVPEPFGLRYTPGDGGAIEVENLPLSDASPETIAGATVPTKIQIALRDSEPLTEEALVMATGAKKPTVNRTLTRLTRERKLIRSNDEKPTYMRGERWQ